MSFRAAGVVQGTIHISKTDSAKFHNLLIGRQIALQPLPDQPVPVLWQSHPRCAKIPRNECGVPTKVPTPIRS